MNQPISLGVVGYNEGNGHPYSWAAICNGYDPAAMAECPYPNIVDYLDRQSWPYAAVGEARVTHVWAPQRSRAEHIAQASRIPNVVNAPTEMLDRVDGILLLRDDPESHVSLALPFLKAGLPIFIDKLVAPTLRQTELLFDSQVREGQIVAGTALRHAPELTLSKEDREAIGDIRYVQVSIIKNWSRYGIHVLEPVLNILGPESLSAVHHLRGWREGGCTQVSVLWENGVQGHFLSTGDASAPITITVGGSKSHRVLTFADTFRCFRNAIQYFVDTVRNPRLAAGERALALIVQDILEQGELACTTS
jgi:predicted dehydrogenase